MQLYWYINFWRGRMHLNFFRYFSTYLLCIFSGFFFTIPNLFRLLSTFTYVLQIFRYAWCIYLCPFHTSQMNKSDRALDGGSCRWLCHEVATLMDHLSVVSGCHRSGEEPRNPSPRASVFVAIMMQLDCVHGICVK